MIKKQLNIILLGLFILTISSCNEIRTSDPLESFRYWAGTYPEDDITIINGYYWSSAHWTHEYEVYLEVRADSNWIKKLINDLDWSSSKDSINQIDGLPNWFEIRDDYQLYKPKGFNQGSFILANKVHEHVFIHDVLL